MTQDNATIIRRFADEVITQGKIDSAAQYVWEDVVEQVPLPGQGPGLDGLKISFARCAPAFPASSSPSRSKLRKATRSSAASNGQVPTRASFSVFPQQSRPVRVWGIVIDRLKNERIKDTRIIMDTLGLMTQLGALPT